MDVWIFVVIVGEEDSIWSQSGSWRFNLLKARKTSLSNINIERRI
jgi:hypothetical protein